MTYSEVWDDESLTIESKAIYGMLCTYAGSGSEAYPSVELLCKKLNISKARFYKHMNLLIGAGVVEKRFQYENGLRCNSIYTLVPNLLKGKNLTVDNLTVDKLTVDKLTKDDMDTNNNNIKNNSINNNNNKESKSKRFTPPTLDEVQSYCEERNNNINAQRFIDFYSCKGWMVGKNKMTDWKAAIRTWEQRDKAQNQPPQEEKPFKNGYEGFKWKAPKDYKPRPDDPFQ